MQIMDGNSIWMGSSGDAPGWLALAVAGAMILLVVLDALS